MQSLNDDERKQVLGEVLADELKAIHELVKDVPVIKDDVRVLRQDVEELKSDMKVVKAAVTDISREQKENDRRITHLETA
jgi:2-phospho-L-lactate guanylyltransferase (CobY/MobA/RfbA family)